MTPPWMRPDVLVVGGGPSGSTLATLMARRGWTVVVVDRASFPRPKPCGEFLSPGALRAMERLRITVPERDRGTVTGWVLQADGMEVATSFPSGAPGASMPRHRLDSTLLSQARREGVKVLERATWVGGVPGVPFDGVAGTGRTLVRIRTDSGPLFLRPRVLVGAGGLRCPVSRALQPESRVRPGRKISLTGHVRGVSCPPRFGHLFVQGDLTVGLAPSDEAGLLWNATVVVPRERGEELRAAGARRFFFECLTRAGLPVGGDLVLEAGGPVASSGFRNRPGRAFAGRAVLVGDAQGYFDPFTGQGIYQALRSAELLAPWLHLALMKRMPWNGALGAYSRRLARERRRTHLLQRAVEWWLTSGPLRPALSRTLPRLSLLFGAIMEATTDRSSLSRAIRGQLRTAMYASDAAGNDLPPYTGYLEGKASSP